ncbi:DUF2867 domain-containing protein [Nonomuraea sp. NPDC050556]|uniref:DUF2867 domain-containing protein n=1 Tax=Nonomuraea sp. NPDC050556 TaxID=3364369 RepID=UPI0037B531B5
MRLHKTAHTSQPWRIHALAPDFKVEDVWALPTPGSPGDLARLVDQFTSGPGNFSGATKALFALRWRLGELFGWDSAEPRTFRDRLPADLRDSRGPDPRAVPMRSVYLTETEWVAEISNRTVHALMHIGWVGDHAQMAVLVKPNGLFGTLYMAAIMPFRYLVVYPALMRMIGRGWNQTRQNDR